MAKVSRCIGCGEEMLTLQVQNSSYKTCSNNCVVWDLLQSGRRVTLVKVNGEILDGVIAEISAAALTLTVGNGSSAKVARSEVNQKRSKVGVISQVGESVGL